jgi:hypothetical protein
MKGPTRSSLSGCAYLDLQNKARREGRSTQELLDLYALEGVLSRLVASGFDKSFVLKGGSLLAAYGSRRPTRDVDLLIENFDADAQSILVLITQVVSHPFQDGLEFNTSGATAEIVRDDDEYQGVRVSMKARLATAELVFHIDVNVGDPVYPPPQLVTLPLLLGGELQLRGYPVPMIHAEKVVTALARGSANTRWRDFADVYRLSRYQSVDADELVGSLFRVAQYRRVSLAPLATVLAGFASVGQARWIAWVRKQRLEGTIPESFDQVLKTVFEFADPVLSGEVTSGQWDPVTQTWLVVTGRL